MALISDMQKTNIAYIGQYKIFRQIGEPTTIKDFMSSSFAVSRLCSVFLLDYCLEVIVEEDDPGKGKSGVHRSMQIDMHPTDNTNDIRFIINRSFND